MCYKQKVRCYICDKPILNVEFDERGSKPCPECLDVIYEDLSEFDDEEENLTLEEYLTLHGEAIQVS